MKKFLSLVLALVMTMSLVTVSAGAKEFTDDDAITYGEAIEVISTIGVVDGYADGKFNPTNNLTRQAAAKIICNLVLGPTTAASLTADTAPFPDVPVNGDFAGYITYCAQRGIINGYPDGTFKPGNPLTGYAFMKMLLGALGYNAEIEGYIGDNWSVAVAKQALGIGLATGLEGEFNGTKTVNREEACLYALNMLQADMVEYGTIINSTVTGNVLNVGTSVARSREWRSSASRVNNIKNDNIIQFAEEYFNKLEKRATTDDFGRPSHTWVYDKQELGSYIDYDKLMTEYTKKVTGKDLFDLIGDSRLNECRLKVYIDGVDTNAVNVDGDDVMFDKTDIKRSNDEKVGATGKGVLTQVFLDTDAELITVAIINTYLAKSTGDYNEKDEDADFTVFGISNVGNVRNPIYVKDTDVYDETTMTAELEDFDMVEDVKEDDIYLVTVAAGKLQTIEAPETLSDVTINGFKKGDWIKTGGTQYDHADTALYDKDAIEDYDKVNLKELTYNVFLDPYGYLIGLEQNEDPDQYVFLTGIDTKDSNIHKGTADGNVIFLDGTMKTVTIDLDKSEGYDRDDKENKKGTLADASGNNLSQLNTWCKYRVNNNDVYTLIEVPVALNENATSKDVEAAQFAQDVEARYDTINANNIREKLINKKHVSLDAALTVNGTTPRVYGNDKTVYLNLELKNVRVDDTNKGGLRRIVDDVESVTVGVKDVDLTVKALPIQDAAGYKNPAEEIYTLYNDKGYIIATVTLDAENNGSAANYVYVTSSKLSYEEYGTAGNNAGGKKGEETWTWAREVFINGEIKDIYETGEHLEYIGKDDMKQGEWYEVKLDADGFVRKSTKLVFDNEPGKYIDEIRLVEAAINLNSDTVVVHDTSTVDKVSFENGTLYTRQDNTYGFHVAENVVTVLALAGKDGDGAGEDEFDEVEAYSGTNGLKQAIRNMNVKDSKDFNDGTVEVSAILEDGSAIAIVINDKNAPGTNGVANPDKDKTPVPTTKDMGVTVGSDTIVANIVYTEKDNLESMIRAALIRAGYMPWSVSFDSNGKTGTAVASRVGRSVGVSSSDWVTFLIEVNYYAEIEVEGASNVYVPCDSKGEWDKEDYDVSSLISTKNGTYVSVEWEEYDEDTHRYYTTGVIMSNDAFEANEWDHNWNVGNYKVVPGLVNVIDADNDTNDYYATYAGVKTTDLYATTNSGAKYAKNGDTLRVSYTLGTNADTAARYKIIMNVGKDKVESGWLTAVDGVLTASFKVGKKDITGFSIAREDVVKKDTVTVTLGTVDVSALSSDLQKAILCTPSVLDATVEKGKGTEVTFRLAKTAVVKEAIQIAITVDGVTVEVLTLNPATDVIEKDKATTKVVIDENAGINQYTVRYSLSNINANAVVNFVLTTPVKAEA